MPPCFRRSAPVISVFPPGRPTAPRARHLRDATLAALALGLLAATPARSARPYRGGAVATAHPQATHAGLSMLERGGNATDAVVSAAFVLAVVGPYHSGIGGGGFALVHQAGQPKVEVLDFREVAPKAAHRDLYVKDGAVAPGLSTDGALSVAVPGAAMGYLTLHAKYGALPRHVVLKPAIDAASRGFWVTPKYRALAADRVDCLRKDAEAARLFLRPNAEGVPDVPPVGTLLKQPELARTLQQLARRGPAPFYRGPLAQAMAKTVQANGGILTEEDLASYQVRWRAPLEGTYRGHRIATMPPPSAGGLAVLQVLGVLELTGTEGVASRDPEVLHRYVEAVRRAYVDRARHLGDPAFSDIPLARLASKEHIQAMAKGIDPRRATPSSSLQPVVGPAEPAPGKKNTTHLSVMDAKGNAVAMTTTVNYGFGSCLVAKGTGILLNDEMDDFAAQPLLPNAYGLVTGEANTIAPGKIPLSSMSPTLVFRKGAPEEVLLAVGSPGGSTIPTTVAQVISNVIDAEMDVVRAVGAGRLHHQYQPDVLMVDRYGLDPLTQKALEAKGHAIRRTEGWGDAEAVFRHPESSLFFSGSDPRNEGLASGVD